MKKKKNFQFFKVWFRKKEISLLSISIRKKIVYSFLSYDLHFSSEKHWNGFFFHVTFKATLLFLLNLFNIRKNYLFWNCFFILNRISMKKTFIYFQLLLVEPNSKNLLYYYFIKKKTFLYNFKQKNIFWLIIIICL